MTFEENFTHVSLFGLRDVPVTAIYSPYSHCVAAFRVLGNTEISRRHLCNLDKSNCIGGLIYTNVLSLESD